MILFISVKARMARIQNTNQDSDPFFLHIPKTGGTSLENYLHKDGINVGKYFFTEHPSLRSIRKRPYTNQCDSFFCPTKDCPHCSGWHCPPRRKISGSFTIVRNPYDRLYSQFLYSMSKDGELVFKDKGKLKCDCHTFRRWAYKAIMSVKTNKSYTVSTMSFYSSDKFCKISRNCAEDRKS